MSGTCEEDSLLQPGSVVERGRSGGVDAQKYFEEHGEHGRHRQQSIIDNLRDISSQQQDECDTIVLK